VVVAWPITLPDVVDKVIVTPAVRGKTIPEIVNGRPLFTDVGGVAIRLRATASVNAGVADASRSHEESVRTRSETDLPISIGIEYVPSIPVIPVVKMRVEPSEYFPSTLNANPATGDLSLSVIRPERVTGLP
jgi:hypothetical protein